MNNRLHEPTEMHDPQRSQACAKPVSRRSILRAAAMLPLAAAAPTALAGCAQESAAAAAPIPAEIQAIMNQPKYSGARWGIYVADRNTGQVIYDLNGSHFVVPGSTTKLFSAAATLDALGPDFRFETPIYCTGPVDARGRLRGDLILVASGDMTMGGRDTSDGRLDFTSIDHNYANAFPALATLTPEDPLAGLNELAGQIAAAGIRQVIGDVIIDARLYPRLVQGGNVFSPIMINDNLIDLTVTPRGVGQRARVAWRPQTRAYRVRSEVQTVPADQPLSLNVASPRPGLIVVEGQIPVTTSEALVTYFIQDPPSFARTLLIEALERRGVTVTTALTGENPEDKLPAEGSYQANQQVALHRSLPFSENVKVILKLSQNQHADTQIFLLALKHGKKAFEEGVRAILPFLQKAGLDDNAISLGDGRGNEPGSLFTPKVVAKLLLYMAKQPTFRVYHDAMPSLGVDGTEVDAVPPTSPIRGKAFAKSGTYGVADLLHFRPFQTCQGLVGYVPSRSGREIAYALYVNNLPLNDTNDVFEQEHDLAKIVEVIHIQGQNWLVQLC